MGIQTSVDLNDISGIEERISKAQKTLNAATGLGIRRNGLTIATCNIIQKCHASVGNMMECLPEGRHFIRIPTLAWYI